MIGIEAQTAAEEVDGDFEVLPIPATAGQRLDYHDLVVEAFGSIVGDPVPVNGQDVDQVPGERLSDLVHQSQA